MVCSALTLKTIRGHVNPPRRETTSISETHSQDSDDLTYERLFSDDARTLVFYIHQLRCHVHPYSIYYKAGCGSGVRCLRRAYRTLVLPQD